MGKVHVVLLNASFRLVANYRIGSYLVRRGGHICTFLSHYTGYKQITKYNCQVSYRAVIGRGIKFPHPLGVVIGEGVVIDENVKIWQHVTLGSHGKTAQEQGYPKVQNDVRIFANAIIFGNVEIGRGATVAASAVVLSDVPKGKVAIGSPARIKT